MWTRPQRKKQFNTLRYLLVLKTGPDTYDNCSHQLGKLHPLRKTVRCSWKSRNLKPYKCSKWWASFTTCSLDIVPPHILKQLTPLVESLYVLHVWSSRSLTNQGEGGGKRIDYELPYSSQLLRGQWFCPTHRQALSFNQYIRLGLTVCRPSNIKMIISVEGPGRIIFLQLIPFSLRSKQHSGQIPVRFQRLQRIRSIKTM